MRDEMTDAWAAYETLLVRLAVLEDIAERMVATCADPVAVADLEAWKNA
jgi:hypothetical protein